MKTAKTMDQAYALEDTKEGQPHCWIQWKGTDVCMDFHCACGESSHIDATFAYFVKCPKCGKVYYCNGHIELIEYTGQDANPVTGEL